MAQLDPRKRTATGTTGGTTTGAALGGPAPAQQSAGSAAPGGAAPSLTGPPQAAQRPGQAGTGFVNLSQVLAANRPAAQQMGAGLVNGVTQKAQQVQTDTVGAKNTYEAAGRAAVLQYDPTKVRAGYNAATSAYKAAPPPSQQGWAYTDQPAYKAWVGSAQPGIDSGKALAETKYTGPKTWEDAGVDVAGLTSRAITAQDEAAALGSAGGRQALLSKQVTGPYSAGNKALDSALLTSAIGGQGQQVASQYANLSETLAAARGESSAAYGANAAATQAAAGKYGADAGALEKEQAGNKELLEYNERERLRSTAPVVPRDGGKPVISNPQAGYGQLPMPGGGVTGKPATYRDPNPEPAPVPNQWGSIPWYARKRGP